MWLASAAEGVGVAEAENVMEVYIVFMLNVVEDLEARSVVWSGAKDAQSEQNAVLC